MDIGFAPNYTHLHQIDITPDAEESTWAYLGPGITTISPNDSDDTDDTAYYDGEGVSTEDVTGVHTGYTIEGDRKYGDPAQDYIAGLRFDSGDARVTNYRHISPDGRIITGKVTVKDIEDSGGDANDKGGFGFGITFRGRPEIESPNKTELPESVSVSGTKSVSVGSTLKLTPNVTPSTASDWCAFAIEDDSIATVDAEGTVTGVSAGKTKLSIKCIAKPSVRAVVEITVTAASSGSGSSSSS